MVSFVVVACTVSSWVKYAPAANGTVMKSEKSCPATNHANGIILTENIVICMIHLTQKKKKKITCFQQIRCYNLKEAISVSWMKVNELDAKCEQRNIVGN